VTRGSADKLALMQEYGHIEFDLLLYHFEAGQKLVYADNKHRAVRRNPSEEIYVGG
jgi:hypothetical protein